MRNRSHLAVAAVLALALSLTAGLILANGATAKKKKRKNVSANITKTVNLPIPDRAAGANSPWGRLDSTIDITGKKFKQKVVGDVNVTVQTTGSGNGAASNLWTQLTAPNGRTAVLFVGIGGSGASGTPSIGPFTMDDDTTAQICDTATPPCAYPDETLNRPFAGTAQATGLFGINAGFSALATFNGVPMKGIWKLTVFDANNTLTSTLNQWRLNVTAQRPVV
jgi:hypothetical protein